MSLDLLAVPSRAEAGEGEQSSERRQRRVLEETCEEQRQKEQLMAYPVSHSQDAEKAWAELVAQGKEREAALQQWNMQDLEWLQEQHRKLLQAMAKDYQDHL